MTVAGRFDLARLSNHGRVVALRRKPRIAVGEAVVALPPGSFLQRPQKGEAEIARHVAAGLEARRIASPICFAASALSPCVSRPARASAPVITTPKPSPR